MLSFYNSLLYEELAKAYIPLSVFYRTLGLANCGGVRRGNGKAMT